MEKTLDAYQCSNCQMEFVVVPLNGKSLSNPVYCPECGDDGEVHKIECLEFTITYKDLQYAVTVKPKLTMM